MNYLELCKRVRAEAGISGIGPVSVTGQIGEMKRIVDWVNTAWNDIQLHRQNWYFMRGTFDFQTTAGDYEYTPTDVGINSDFAQWDYRSMRIFNTANGMNDENALQFLPYQDFRRYYMTGVQPQARPLIFSVNPALNFVIGPYPNDIYTVSGEYFKKPQVLAANGDIPTMPEQFHMLIVYGALKMYARYDAAGEIYEDAKINYGRLINRLEIQQLAPMMPAAPLVA